jgi:hypothetical protein
MCTIGYKEKLNMYRKSCRETLACQITNYALESYVIAYAYQHMVIGAQYALSNTSMDNPCNPQNDWFMCILKMMDPVLDTIKPSLVILSKVAMPIII